MTTWKETRACEIESGDVIKSAYGDIQVHAWTWRLDTSTNEHKMFVEGTLTASGGGVSLPVNPDDPVFVAVGR